MALDPYYSNVSLLLPMEGANNQVAFIDYSPTPKIITPIGNTKISETQSKWGLGSGFFDGNGDYFSIANHTDFVFNTGDFTIEFWIYPLSSQAAFPGLINKGAGISSATAWEWFMRENLTHTFRHGGGSTYDLNSGALSANAWTHLAVTKNSGVMKLYVNGIVSATITVNFNYSDTSALRIARATNDFNGYLQDLRISKGVARYTANFTPPSRLLIQHVLPVSGQVTTMTGNCIVSGNGGAQQVVIRDASTRLLIQTAIPDEATGDWTASVPPGDYDITYFAPNCQPICHGPYTVAPP